MIKALLLDKPEMNYLIGVRFGDGYLNHRKAPRNNWIFRIEAKDKDFVKECNNCYSIIGHREYPIWERETGGTHTYRIDISSKNLYQFLNQPLELLKSYINQYPIEFIRGFTDSEGSMSINTNHWKFVSKKGKISSGIVFHPSIQIANQNLEILKYIQQLLLEMNIYSKIRKAKITKNGMNYSLSIEKLKDIETFMKKIGFSIQRKEEVYYDYKVFAS